MQKIFPAFILLLASCRETGFPETHTSFKDSVLNEYFTQIDSLEFYDTTDYHFKTLKAYYKDDISFFKQMQKDIESERKYAIEQSSFDSCFPLRKLHDLNVDEVYRFRHGQSFCYYSQVVTISRKGDSILLHFLEISGSPDGKIIEYRDKTIGPGCKIEKQFTKPYQEKTGKFWKTRLNRQITGGSGHTIIVQGLMGHRGQSKPIQNYRDLLPDNKPIVYIDGVLTIHFEI